MTARLLLPSLLLAALAAAVLATGCGGDDEAEGKTAVPSGWKAVEQPRFAFSVPRAWSVETRESTASPGEQVTEVTAPGTPAGVQVVVGATPGFGTGFDRLIAVNDGDTRLRLPKRKLVSQESVEVAGAKDARLTILDLPAGAPGAGAVPTRAFDLIALSEKGTAVNLFARVPVSEAERMQVRQVVDSLRLRGA